MSKSKTTPKMYRIYVVELHEDAWQKPRLRKRNPARRLDKPCLYVGYSEHSPEQRFEQHRNGKHAAPIVRDYGLGLKPRLCENAPVSSTRAEAEKVEARWAERLRRRGFGVWEGRLGPVQPG